MIGAFKSRRLRRLWEKADSRGINREHQRRVQTILSMLEAANALADLNVPGFHLHALKQHRPTRHSLRVSGNWRVTFVWRQGVADDIDYEDYH